MPNEQPQADKKKGGDFTPAPSLQPTRPSEASDRRVKCHRVSFFWCFLSLKQMITHQILLSECSTLLICHFKVKHGYTEIWSQKNSFSEESLALQPKHNKRQIPKVLFSALLIYALSVVCDCMWVILSLNIHAFASACFCLCSLLVEKLSLFMLIILLLKDSHWSTCLTPCVLCMHLPDPPCQNKPVHSVNKL